MSRRFHTTSWGLVLQARGEETAEATEALEQLCSAYWFPLYGFVRSQGYSEEQAADLVQSYFALLLEKHYLNAVEPDAGRFRSFLLASLKNFLRNEHDRETALKRGGGLRGVSLDIGNGEERLRVQIPDVRTPEVVFERRWAFTVIDRVLDTLAAERARAGKSEEFEQLRGYLNGEEPHVSYREVAGLLGTSEGAVAVAVHRLRSRFGQLLREEIERTVVDPDDVDDEIRHLLEVIGTQPPRT